MGNQSEKQGSTIYVALISVVATLGGLLFGYDTAVVSGAIGFIRQHFVLDAIHMGWAASSALVGCMIGAAIAGPLSDWAGRKKILMLSAFLFTVSALGAAFPRNLTELILARILGGIGIGTASVLSPLYISEISPARMRGRLVSLNQLAIVSGILLVYLVNSQIARAGDELWNVELGWRWMFGLGALPAVIFWVLLFFVPESPRWLSKQGERDEALRIMTRVGGAAHAESELREIESTLEEESGSVLDLIKPGMRVALFVGVALAVLSQITGINVVMYYAPEIFKSAGSKATQAIGDTVFVGIVNLLSTLVAIWLVDRAGRKKLLILPTLGMGIFLAMLGSAFYFERTQGPWVLLFVLGYVACFAVGMGPVGWVVISEIYPTKIRGRGMSIATVMLWISCFMVSQFFPFMLEKLKGNVFFVYSAISILAFIFFVFFVPETKGKTLEEIEKMWEGRKNK